MRVRVYFVKGRPAPSEIEEAETIQRWMLSNLYDLVWEAEFKNLVTPEVIASVFRVEATPFGIPFKKRHNRTYLSLGDLIQIGSTLYLVLQKGFRETEIPRAK